MSRLQWITDWAERARKSGYHSNNLAKLCSVSPSQLRRFFNEVCGCPPQVWLDELRLWHSTEMLCRGLPVKEVASTLNFSSASHFCQRFKRYHGCTPARFTFIYHERMNRLKSLDVDDVESWAASHLRPWEEAERTLLRRFCRPLARSSAFESRTLSMADDIQFS